MIYRGLLFAYSFGSFRFVSSVINDHIIRCDNIVVSHILLIGERLFAAAELRITRALSFLWPILVLRTLNLMRNICQVCLRHRIGLIEACCILTGNKLRVVFLSLVCLVCSCCNLTRVDASRNDILRRNPLDSIFLIITKRSLILEVYTVGQVITFL